KQLIQEVIKCELNAFGKTAGYIKWKSVCVLNEGSKRTNEKGRKYAEAKKKLKAGIVQCSAEIDEELSTSTLIINFFCRVFQDKILHQNLNIFEVKHYIRFLNWLKTNEKFLPTSIEDKEKAIDESLLLYLSTLIYPGNIKALTAKKDILIRQFENNKDYIKLHEMYILYLESKDPKSKDDPKG
ncbi:MAG: hypothetical protein ACRDDF_12620, partial [Aeromonas sp.]